MVSSLKLNAESFFESLKQFPAQSEIKTWWLAYSGGVDSQVLLHLLSEIKIQYKLDVRAVYIDHGLQAESKKWQAHCASSCEKLSIPFQAVSVNVDLKTGEGTEASARTARYAALAELIEKDHCLLTAQHQDDQAETLLLQLFRSAGAAGLAAMPFYSLFSKGWHIRPLLNFNQEEILNYANAYQLEWVEDPSNQNDRFDRNLIRNQIIPLIKKRWPSLERTLSVAANQQSENKELLNDLALHDYLNLDSDAESLSIDGLLKLTEARQRNVLRYWIARLGFALPPRNVLAEIIQQIFYSNEDAMPDIRWANAEVHRFKNRLYVIKTIDHDVEQTLELNSHQSVMIESLGKKLDFEKIKGKGLKPEVLDKKIELRFRKGGEKIKPTGRKETHSLKKLFQESEVPPWKRTKIPLLFIDNELIAVVDYWIADEYSVEQKETGYWPKLVDLEF